MAIVIEASDYEEVLNLISSENIEGVHIATITDDPEESDKDMLTMKRSGNTIVNLHRSFLDQNGAERHLKKAVIDFADSEGLFTGIHSDVEKLLHE